MAHDFRCSKERNITLCAKIAVINSDIEEKVWKFSGGGGGVKMEVFKVHRFRRIYYTRN